MHYSHSHHALPFISHTYVSVAPTTYLAICVTFSNSIPYLCRSMLQSFASYYIIESFVAKSISVWNMGIVIDFREVLNQ